MSQQRKNMQDYLLIWIDAVCLVISYIAACFLASVFRKFIFDFSSVLSSLWMILISYFLVFLSFNMNRYFMKRNKYEEITYTIKLNIIMGAVLIAVFYVTKYRADQQKRMGINSTGQYGANGCDTFNL